MVWWCFLLFWWWFFIFFVLKDATRYIFTLISCVCEYKECLVAQEKRLLSVCEREGEEKKSLRERRGNRW